MLVDSPVYTSKSKLSPAILTRVRGATGEEHTARNQKKEHVAERSCDTMLEAIDDVQNKENPVYDDEDQVDFAFGVPNRHIASKLFQEREAPGLRSCKSQARVDCEGNRIDRRNR